MPEQRPDNGPDAGRSEIDTEQPFRLGDYVIRPRELRVDSPNGQEHLEPRVMQVLTVLADAAGDVVTRNEIIDKVWPGAIISDESLSRCIYQIRKHLPPAPGQKPLVRTIRKQGYSLTVRPQPLEPLTVGERPSRSRPRKLRLQPVHALIAGLLLAGLIFFWPDTIHRDAVPDRSTQNLVSQGPAIAVLPFEDLSPDASRSVLADGFPEDLLAGLGRRRALQVSAWASSRQFPLDRHSPAEAGEALNVDALLTGTIHVEGDDVRVSAELISAADDRQMWSGVYEASLASLHEIHDDIAHQVVAVLGVSADEFRIDRLTDTVAAHELYVEGRHYLNRRSAGALQQAIDYFRQAIEADPTFAEAYAGLADAHILATQYERAPLPDATAAAQAAIDRALTLDPTLAEAVASQGLLYLHNGDLPEASRSLRRAAAMYPNYANAHNWLARSLDLQGQASKALEVYRRGLRLDPMSVILNMNVARMLTYTGKLPQAQAYLERAATIDPDFPNTWWAMAYNSYLQGKLDQANDYYQHAFDLGLLSPYAMAGYAQSLSFQGRFDEALDWLDRSDAIASHGQTILPRARWFELQNDHASWLNYARRQIDRDRSNPHFRYLAARALLHMQDTAAAVAMFREGMALDDAGGVLLPGSGAERGDLFALDLACALQHNGDRAAAERLLDDIRHRIDELRANGIALPGLDYTDAVQLSLSGRSAAALQRLQQVAESGWPGWRTAARDPRLQDIVSQPGFRRLMAGTAASHP